MWRSGRLIVGVLVLAGSVSLARAQDDALSQAEKKLLSKRAAEADAFRKLAETIRGLQITSRTYVRDFVAESDDIQAELDAFIRGVRLGQPRWYDDLSCEVPAEVTVERVIEELKRLHARYYKGDQIKATDFDQIRQRVHRDVIQVVGMGAPRPDLPPGVPEGVEGVLEPPPANLPEPPIPDLWKRLGPQARLMAIQAARVDARRRLVERILGLRITSRTQVRDFVAESDEIASEAMGMLRGARDVRVYLHHDEPIAEVTVEVPVEQVITTVKQLHTRFYQGGEISGSDLERVTQQIRRRTFQETGMGVPPRKYVEAAMQQAASGSGVVMPAWATSPLRATGHGVIATAEGASEAQARLMAARAAELDAKRKLVEQVLGLTISSNTTVRDFVTQRDEIRARVEGVLMGAYVEDTRFGPDVVEVDVVLPGAAVWSVISEEMRVRSSY